MATVDKKALKNALLKRKAFVLKNLETMTLKKLRSHLEKDLGLEADALKPHKQQIAEFVDSLMAPPEQPEEEKAGSSGSESDDEEGSASKKRKGGVSTSAAPKAAPRTYTKKVERIRSLCRQATITIPPNIYSKNKTDKELEAAMEALLSKHGLSANSGQHDVAKVKQQLQLQRDLDGIDTSNIISDSRRSRRGATTNYKKMLKVGSDTEGEDEEEEEEEEEQGVEGKEGAASDSGSDSDVEASSDDDVVVHDRKPKSAEKRPTETKKQPVAAAPKVKRAEPPGGSKVVMAGDDALTDIGNNTILGNIPKKQRVIDWSDDDDE